MLRRIPHSVDIKIGFVADLPVNSDIMGSKPDVFVLINTFRKIGDRNRLYSCAETRTIKAATDAVYEEEFRCASIGEGMVVVNVVKSEYSHCVRVKLRPEIAQARVRCWPVFCM